MAYADLSGRQIYYERHGDFDSPDALPLVLIMGLAGSCAGWLPLQVPYFSKTRPVLIFDNRGVAESDDPGAPFTTADLAKDTSLLLDSLGIERADVLGSFMGGMTAQELALIEPDRIERLVLVGTYARPDAKRRTLLRHWSDLVERQLPRACQVNEQLLWTLSDETLEQTDLIRSMTDFYNSGEAPVSADLFARQCDACISHDTVERLAELKPRTLIIGGRHDQLTPRKFHSELDELIPDSRLVTLSYGAHLVMVECAERFNQVVTQFLDDDR